MQGLIGSGRLAARFQAAAEARQYVYGKIGVPSRRPERLLCSAVKVKPRFQWTF